MQRLLQTLALLLTLFTFAAASHAKDDGHDKDRAFITKAYAAMDTALDSKDVAAYVHDTANDFVFINPNGKEATHGKAEHEQKLTRAFIRYQNINAYTTITNIIFDNEGAMVTVTSKFSADVVISGKPAVYVDRGKSYDFWVKFGNNWQEKRSKKIESIYLFYEKPVKQHAAR